MIFFKLILIFLNLKLYSYSYKELMEAPEYGDFDVFHCLKGWIPERLPITGHEDSLLWGFLKSFNLKSYGSGNRSITAPSVDKGRQQSLIVSQSQVSTGAEKNPAPFTVVFAHRELQVSVLHITITSKRLIELKRI